MQSLVVGPVQSTMPTLHLMVHHYPLSSPVPTLAGFEIVLLEFVLSHSSATRRVADLAYYHYKVA